MPKKTKDTQDMGPVGPNSNAFGTWRATAKRAKTSVKKTLNKKKLFWVPDLFTKSPRTKKHKFV